MLVLTRKKHERLLIGDDIVLTIVEIKRGSVRLGVEAPRDVRIMRQEIAPKEQADEPDAAR